LIDALDATSAAAGKLGDAAFAEFAACMAA
jgi:hypothetical protein